MLILLAAGGVAALIPTLRALRADPLQALRHE
jgi:ABC-type antimicrobial peptide transport system permease subunit